MVQRVNDIGRPYGYIYLLLVELNVGHIAVYIDIFLLNNEQFDMHGSLLRMEGKLNIRYPQNWGLEDFYYFIKRNVKVIIYT